MKPRRLPVFVACLLRVAAPLSLGAAGDLDPGFGTGGKVTTSFAGAIAHDAGYGVAIQSDGKIVVAGKAGNADSDFALARYTAGGGLDTSFSLDGKVTTNYGIASSPPASFVAGDDIAYGVAVQPDGKIVAAGSTYRVNLRYFVVARYTAAGDRDLPFGNGDSVEYSFWTTGSGTAVNSTAYAMAVQGDGKIVVAGEATGVGFGVARFTDMGVLDTSFGTGGKVTTPIGSNGSGRAVAVQSDGKIVVAGYSFIGGNFDFVVARYTATGALDADFGTGGIVTTGIGGSDMAYGVALQSDGKILVAGKAQIGTDDFALVRYTAAGALDTGFGTGGIVTTPIGSSVDAAQSVAVQSDGKIVLAGYAVTGPNQIDFALARYTAGGVLDSTFGSGGKLTTPIGSGNDFAYALAMQSDGKIVAAGSANTGGADDFALVRYESGIGPEIDVSGNASTIFDGDTTPGVADLTDFGNVIVNGGTLAHTFTISNSGTQDLSIGTVTIGGANAADFTVTAAPAPLAAPGGSTTFQITFDPGASGPCTATVSIPGNDVDENPFDFSLRGVGGLDNADLSTLTLNAGALAPAFAAGTTNYTASVAYGNSTVFVTPVNTDNAVIQVRVNGGGYTAVTSGSPSGALPLNVGENGVAVRVTAADGTTVKIYTITVTRAEPAAGDLDPGFGTGGKVTTSFGGAIAHDAGYGVAIQSDGKIVVAGKAGNADSDFALARYTAAGGLDTSFSLDGKVTTNYGIASSPPASFVAGDDIAYGVAVQPDGKIVAAGSAYRVNLRYFVVARYTTAGGQDLSFGNGDSVEYSFWTTSSGTAVNSTAYAMALQGDGKIVLAGEAQGVGFGVARFTGTGVLDADFGTGGKVTTPIGSNGSGRAVALQSDGKIVVAGYSFIGGNFDFVVARYTATGVLDADFGTGGIVTTGIGGSDMAYGVALQSDGKILVAGKAQAGTDDFALVRYTAAGALDTGFGTGGIVTTPIGSSVDVANSMAVQSDGKIVLAGSSFAGANFDFALARYTAGGVLDTTFGSGGKLTTPIGSSNDFANALAMQSDGKIVAAGSANTAGGDDFALVRYESGLGPEIDVSGNATNIANGHAAPGPADHTDFGHVIMGSGTLVRTFTITNNGTSDLSVGTLTVSGANAADFTVTAAPASPVAAGSSTTFQVTFAPGASGPRTATVNVPGNDADENPFHFSIQGTGVASSDASLAALTLSSGPLSPAFAPSTLSYSADSSFLDPTITVTATKAAPAAAIAVRINDGAWTGVVSGSPAGPLPVNHGANTVEVRVTAQDGTTTLTYSIAVTRLPLAWGEVDPGFVSVDLAYVGGGPIPIIWCTAQQPDGRILVGGKFTVVAGQPRNYIVRLNADGSLDPGFADPGLGTNQYGETSAIAVQNDGKILLRGRFGFPGNTLRRLVRLNANGTMDTVFNDRIPDPDSITGMAVQPDGKILLGGISVDFTSWFIRLNSDGTPDGTFNATMDTPPTGIALQSDGKMLLMGGFSSVGGQPRNYLARLNAGGALDPTLLNPPLWTEAQFYSVAVQPDGKILLAGTYSNDFGEVWSGAIRLHADGTVDPALSAAGGNPPNTMAIQADGKIVLAGYNLDSADGSLIHLLRYHADGSLDTRFLPGPNHAIFSAAVQADGKIIVTGLFTGINGVPRAGIARLGNGPATQSLSTPGPGRAVWLRGGTSPEAESVTFEVSTDGGASYTPPGTGTRISGGWEITGLSLPPTGHLRARARTIGGNYNTSSGLVEQVAAFSFPLAPLQLWRQAHFGIAGNSGNAANDFDFDNDGIPNLVEWGCGLDPTIPDTLPVVTARPGTDIEFTYVRSVAAVNAGTLFTVEWSETLPGNPWSSTGVTESILSDNGTVQQVKATIPAGGAGRLFVKLKVIEAP